MKPTPAQLANLRPLSADPAKASAQAKKTGFGTGTAKQCEATAKSGQRCKCPAAYGTPKCVKHGARRYKGTPPSPWAHLWAARRALARLDPDPELIRNPAWANARNVAARYALAVAWQAAQDGNPAPWRNLTTTPPTR